MTEYNLIVPVIGSIQISICAQDAEEAFDILMDKKDILENIPHGHLEMELSKIIVVENNNIQN